jgi:outer membrane protein TolC
MRTGSLLAALAFGWPATVGAHAASDAPTGLISDQAAGAAVAAGNESDPIALAETLERSTLIAAVLERNPSLAAARQAWRAAAERPRQVSALENPTVAYALAPLSIGSGVTVGQEIELSQPLAFAGRRRAREAMATAEAAMLEADLATLRLELARRAELLFVDYALTAELLRIHEHHGALLEDLQRAAAARYAAGQGSQQDPLQAESELAHVLHERVQLLSQQRILGAQLNTLLHRAPGEPLPPPPSRPPTDAQAHGMVDAARFEESALARPELRSAAWVIEARRAELDLARRESGPLVEVMTAYEAMWSDREHRWLVGGSVSVPLWRRRIRAGVAEAEAKLAQAENERAARAQEVRGEVWEAAQRLGESEHVLGLYRDRLLPIALDRVEAALAGFRSGTNDFVALIDAERNQREAELGYQQALADLDRNHVELARAAGIADATVSTTTAEPGAETGQGDRP